MFQGRDIMAFSAAPQPFGGVTFPRGEKANGRAKEASAPPG